MSEPDGTYGGDPTMCCLCDRDTFDTDVICTRCHDAEVVALRAKVKDYEQRGMGKLDGYRVKSVMLGAAGGDTIAVLTPVEEPAHHGDTESTESTEKGGGE